MIMRRNLSDVTGYCVHARDGSLGIVQDIYFDDIQWMVRYLAVSGEGGKSRPANFLLAPEVISSIDREFGLISVFLRTAAVLDSPAVTATRDLPRQEERRLREYYGWPNYWPAPSSSEQFAQAQASVSPHLHSLATVLGYRLLAGTEDLGPLTNLIVDDHTWKIHCLEMDVSSWRPAGRGWVPTEAIKQLREAKQQIALTIRREAVMDSPQTDQQVRSVPEAGLVPLGTALFAKQLYQGAPAA
jgi:hypothetical protein